jgi:hypothetical protein
MTDTIRVFLFDGAPDPHRRRRERRRRTAEFFRGLIHGSTEPDGLNVVYMLEHEDSTWSIGQVGHVGRGHLDWEGEERFATYQDARRAARARAQAFNAWALP